MCSVDIGPERRFREPEVPGAGASEPALEALLEQCEAQLLVHSNAVKSRSPRIGRSLPVLWVGFFLVGLCSTKVSHTTEASDARQRSALGRQRHSEEGLWSIATAGSTDGSAASRRWLLANGTTLPGAARGAEALAFVLMAQDEPGVPEGESLWSVLALARSLKQLSGHPVVLLTNATKFPDGTPAVERLALLGVSVRPLQQVDVAGAAAEASRAFRKLQAWAMTEFDKVVWLDSDTIVYRDIDWLFTRDGTWAARDDKLCQLNADSMNSAIMLLHPNDKDYIGLLQHAAKHASEKSVEQVIETYFTSVRQQPVQLLSEVEAAFGQCISGKTPTPYRNLDGTAVRGTWSVPAIVHRSGGVGPGSDNVCFSINIGRQLHPAAKKNVNVCHYHPLAAYWREHFCHAAVRVLKMSGPQAVEFCSDYCYYQEVRSPCQQTEIKIKK